mgnify:CR=1 FL=1
MRTHKIAAIPGDGIGIEVINELVALFATTFVDNANELVCEFLT